MKNLWRKILIRTTFRNEATDHTQHSSFKLAKAYRLFLISTKRLIKDVILITIGIFSAAFGFKGFLLTNHFIDGGATGISLLISAITKIPLPILIVCVNIPFIILAYKIIDRLFAIKTVLA